MNTVLKECRKDQTAVENQLQHSNCEQNNPTKCFIVFIVNVYVYTNIKLSTKTGCTL